MEQNNNQNQKGYGGDYGKKNLWKWILLYVIIGGLIYAAVYYFFFYNKGGYSSNNSSQYPNNYQPTTNNNSNSNTMPQTQNPSPTTASVSISNFMFSPATLTVKKGTMITWTNNDSVAHTVTGDNGGPASQSIAPGGQYSYTFNSVGVFPYHCSIHPHMKAIVQVTE